MLASLNLRVTRLWRWLLLLFAVVVVLFMVEMHVLRHESAAPSQWREWVLTSSDKSISAPPSDLVQDPYFGPPLPDASTGKTILPSARGRVLVTGGGGMIGKRVVRRLLQAKIPVTVLDVIFFEEEVADIERDFPDGDLRVIIGDIRDESALESAMDGAKGVIHLAAVSRVLWCLENLKDCTDVNVRGTELVLNALKTGWFIQASSREVYGNPKDLPALEDLPHEPANVYGQSKASAEEIIVKHVAQAKASGSKNINAIMLRLSNVYGSAKDHPERLIPAIMRNALSNRPIQMVGGDQDLDMVFVEDVVDAISLSVTRLHSKTYGWLQKKGLVETYNVGTGHSTSAMTLIRKTLWLTNSSSPLRIIPADNRFPSHYVGSTVKAASVLGYKARVSIDAGLHRLATETLSDTARFLRAKRESEPFLCDKPKRYSMEDLLSLNTCKVIVSTHKSNFESMYATYRWHEKDGKRVEGYNQFEDTSSPAMWNMSIVRNEDNHEEARVSFRWIGRTMPNSEYVYKMLLPTPGHPNDRKEHKPEDSDNEFLVRVDPQTGRINIRTLEGKPLQLSWPKGTRRRSRNDLPTAHDIDGLEADYNDEFARKFDYDWRIVPVCCPNTPQPWPFFRDDAIASHLVDSRRNTFHAFNASQIQTTCDQLKAAEEFALHRLRTLDALKPPLVLQEAPLPFGRAPDWRVRRFQDICRNMCDHPTFCVDTGNCACGHASQCTPKPRFPFSNVANVDTLSYPIPELSSDPEDDQALVKTVARSNWANILNSDARRYMGGKPDWPLFTIVRDPEYVEEFKKNSTDTFYQLRNSPYGCFSADTVMERAAQRISKNYQQDKSLVFLPFFSYNHLFEYPDVIPYIDNAMKQLPLSFRLEIDTNDMIMTFTHDFGRCNTGMLDVLSLRRWYTPQIEKHRRVTAWAPMGDLYSMCYFQDQDVVIPARTCLTPHLLEKFGQVSQVKPVRQRSILVAFAGRTDSILAGSTIRNKVTCDRSMVSPGNLVGGESLPRYWLKQPNNDYMQGINETIFCPLPRGTTGWATRMVDVIYGGCIPVMFGDHTHHPFWDVIDWSKIAIFVDEWDIQRLEEILLSYTWEQLEQIQANLMLVRDAFVYPNEDKMDESIHERGPFWFALHSSVLRKLTKYPT